MMAQALAAISGIIVLFSSASAHVIGGGIGFGAASPPYGIAPSPYVTPSPRYGARSPQYGAPSPPYGAPSPPYGAPPPPYGAPPPPYGVPSPPYGDPRPPYGVAADQDPFGIGGERCYDNRDTGVAFGRPGYGYERPGYGYPNYDDVCFRYPPWDPCYGFQGYESAYGSPGYERVDYANGDRAYGRPGYGRPGYGRPSYGRPSYGRPGDGRGHGSPPQSGRANGVANETPGSRWCPPPLAPPAVVTRASWDCPPSGNESQMACVTPPSVCPDPC